LGKIHSNNYAIWAQKCSTNWFFGYFNYNTDIIIEILVWASIHAITTFVPCPPITFRFRV
jgi:hypothetical protein